MISAVPEIPPTVVQLMRDSRGQGPDARHLLGPHQFLLEILLLRDVIDDLDEHALAFSGTRTLWNWKE
jgi:hypothetical protein